VNLKEYTREEVREIMDFSLRRFVPDEPIRDHLSNAFISSIVDKLKMFPILGSKKPDRTVIHNMYQHGAYDMLVRWGDSALLLSGFFPEWTSKERRASLGMGYYAGVGMGCYKQAVFLSKEGRAKNISTDPDIVDHLSDMFRQYGVAYLRTREGIQHDYEVDYPVAHEFVATFGAVPRRVKYITFEKPLQGDRNGLSEVYGSQILDAKDIDLIPVEPLINMAFGKEEDETKRYGVIKGHYNPADEKTEQAAQERRNLFSLVK
jgi:hypothetical protein